MQKPITRLIKTVTILSFVIISGLFILIVFTGPDLPDGSSGIIDEVIHSEVPELVRGSSGTVVSDHTKIWYEAISPKSSPKGTVVLFSGMATDALMWPQSFIACFVDSGYRVVRYDYRDTGASGRVADWTQNPYTVSDLAKDAKVILDALGIRQVHLVGMSLGGIVAQKFALAYPDSTLSLTSMMSSGNLYDKELPSTSRGIAFEFLKIGIKYGLFPGEANTIKMMLAAQTILRGDARYKLDVRSTAERVLYNLRKRNGYNPDASSVHDRAARRSRFDYERLKEIHVPVLILHGKNDPLVPIEHSQKLASMIPGAKTKWIDNMGHDLPDSLIPSLCSEIILHLER